MNLDLRVLGQGLGNTGQFLASYLMKEFERKKDLEDFKTRTKYGADIYGEKQKDILGRQQELEKFKREQDRFESIFGKDPFLFDVYKKGTAPEAIPEDSDRWSNFLDIKTTLAQRQPLNSKQLETLKTFPGTTQADILSLMKANEEKETELAQEKGKYETILKTATGQETERQGRERYRKGTLDIMKGRLEQGEEKIKQTAANKKALKSQKVAVKYEKEIEEATKAITGLEEKERNAKYDLANENLNNNQMAIKKEMLDSIRSQIVKKRVRLFELFLLKQTGRQEELLPGGVDEEEESNTSQDDFMNQLQEELMSYIQNNPDLDEDEIKVMFLNELKKRGIK